MVEKSLKREVYVGIFTAIVVMAIVQPALQLGSNLLFWAGANLYEGFSDGIYKSAALGFHEIYSFQLLILFLGGVCGILINAVLATRRIDCDVEDVEDELNQSSVEELKNRLQNLKRRVKSLRIVATIFSSISIIIILYVYVSNFAELQLNTSFNQRLAVLAPQISDQQLKDLRAQWALMTKRDDYLKIQNTMERLAKEHKIKLPKLRRYWE